MHDSELHDSGLPDAEIHDSESPAARSAPAPSPAESRGLAQRSDAQGLLRFGAHLAAIYVTGSLYALTIEHSLWVLSVPAAIVYGFTLVTLFVVVHECAQRTAFETQGLNDAAGWLAGLLSFNNSTFYRYHRGFTHSPGRDPERDDPKATSTASYVLELSGLRWWLCKLRTHFSIALGFVDAYPFLNQKVRGRVINSIRFQLLTYALGILVSLAEWQPLLFTYWLLPLAAGRPLLCYLGMNKALLHRLRLGALSAERASSP